MLFNPEIHTTKSRAIKLAEEAFQAGENYHHYSDGPGPWQPDQEKFIEEKQKEL